MNKKAIIWSILFTGLSFQASAAAGYANDGLEFVLFLVGFLLLAAGFIEGINFLRKNWRVLAHRVKTFNKKKIITH